MNRPVPLFKHKKGSAMWLFTKHGFYSIVQHNDDSKLLLVRARVDGDIEKYWPKSEIIKGGGTDYLYRATIPRLKVATGVALVVNEIDYPNFKNCIEDKRRGPYYFSVWDQMASMQDEFENG